VNALANPEVGKFVNENFCSAYQRVGTFRIVGKQKQGGNVAAYFCAPDGRVLHCVAGPVNANVMLAEAKWVVDTARKAIKDCKGNGAEFKAIFRKAHAEKLRTEHGLSVDPITYDPPVEEEKGALTYRDPSGRPLAPVLNPVPINGPDVTFEAKQAALARAPGAGFAPDRHGRRVALNNQGRVNILLAAHCMAKIEKVYASVFEGILGERVTTQPVQVDNPFPWHGRPNARPVPAGVAPLGANIRE
jgi:hypothetical protein